MPPTPADETVPIADIYTAYEPYHPLGSSGTFLYPKTAIQTEKTLAHPSYYPLFVIVTNAYT